MGLTPQPTAGGILARRFLVKLAEGTADPPGVTRAAYGPGEQFVHDLARAEGEALGATAETDAAGNLYLTRLGTDPALPRLVVGSHADSVPHGGNYDGALGIAVGLGVMAGLREDGIRLRRSLTVMLIRAEEAVWFPLSYPGSLAALGLLPPVALEARRSDTGLTLAEHIRQAGFDPDAVRRGVAHLKREDVAAFIEVHIEQGSRLHACGRSIGIVTGIAGGFRYTDARCLGAYGHSGAEPRSARRDSVVGFSDLVQGLEQEWDALEAERLEATVTFGRVESDRDFHGASRVLGELRFALDIRSEHQAVLDRLRVRVSRLCAEIGSQRRVAFELGPSFAWDASTMDPAIRKRLESAALSEVGASSSLPSGAGHDASVFAAAGIPSGMIFVRNTNGSHNPDESICEADIDSAISTSMYFANHFDD